MKLYPSEKYEYIDQTTKRSVIQWTNSDQKDQHLYFTSPSVTQDDRWLVFISERDGFPNLYAIDRRDGKIHQLTYNTKGLLRSYVYAQGGLEGLSKASPCLDSVHNRVFFIENNRVKSVDLETKDIDELFEIPEHWWTAYTHISADGQYLCIPCTDPRAFSERMKNQWDQLKSVPNTMKSQSLVSKIYRIAIQTKQCDLWAEVPFWVTHVQFSPRTHQKLIFNQEGFGQNCVPRIWCLEWDGQYRSLFNQDKHTVCTHENWSLHGDYIVYHGWNKMGAFLEARSWDGTLVYRSSMPSFSLGHVTPAPQERFIIDGIKDSISLVSLRNKKSSWEPIQNLYRWIWYLSGKKKVQKILPFFKKIHDSLTDIQLKQDLNISYLCQHNTDPSLKDQDAHVHASIVPRLTSLIFTSDRQGTCNVYEVCIDQY